MGWTRLFAVACLVAAAALTPVRVHAAGALAVSAASSVPAPSDTGGLSTGPSVSGPSAGSAGLWLGPASGPPGTVVSVAPGFGRATTCELDWDGTVLEQAFACGQTNGGFRSTSFTVPDKPGRHVVTACRPTCPKAAQTQQGIFTVTDPAAPDTASVAAGAPSLAVSIPESVLKTLSRTTPVARPVVVSMTVTPLARPVAAQGTPPFGLIGAVIALLLLVSLGGGLFVHRRPRARHGPLPGPLVVVTTYARTRTVRTSRPSPDAPRVRVTARRGRSAQVYHERRRQEFRP